MQGRSHEPKLDKQNLQSLQFFFVLLFFFKDRLEFLGQASWRKEQNWQTSRKTNVEARKYLLGKWQKRLQSASGHPNNPYKNTQTAPTTTHGRSNQQASAEMTPLALSSVSCKFKVNSLEPRQLEPIGLSQIGLSQWLEPKATEIKMLSEPNALSHFFFRSWGLSGSWLLNKPPANDKKKRTKEGMFHFKTLWAEAKSSIIQIFDFTRRLAILPSVTLEAEREKWTDNSLKEKFNQSQLRQRKGKKHF